MKNLMFTIAFFLVLSACGKKETATNTAPLVVEGQTQRNEGVQPTQTPQANPHGTATANPHGGTASNPHARQGYQSNPHAGNPHAANPHARMPAGHPPVRGGSPGPVNARGRAQGLPSGHPPVAPRAGQGTQPRTIPNANALPLRETGPGGAIELARIEKQFPEGEDRTLFQSAFKRVFTPNRQQRDPVGATRDLRSLAGKYPKAAPVYRVMGYAAVDNGFQTQLAFRMYNKAIELDPDYGEVHYALAFLYVMSDKATGAAHYKMALKLGVEDQRGIGQRFYPHLVK